MRYEWMLNDHRLNTKVVNKKGIDWSDENKE